MILNLLFYDLKVSLDKRIRTNRTKMLKYLIKNMQEYFAVRTFTAP